MAEQFQNICILLEKPENYNPDTVDLENNQIERDYWLPCLGNMVKKFIKKASSLNPDNPQATEKAELCYQKFHELIEKAYENPQILKPLSIRTLMEFNENNLRANGFIDAWYLQKKSENIQALKQFENRIKHIDSIKNFEDKWLEIITGVLAGNVFDWGSMSVADILENTMEFGLIQAMNTIEKRPWFQDNLDVWIARLKKQPYKEAVIFVDNAGADFILGILPLAKELLTQGTKVILTANSYPALNDITLEEAKIYTNKAACYCSILKEGIYNKHLIFVENGQKGPCLDLSNLSPNLCKLLINVDLIILEGMGRAVHTNLYTKFNVDSLKLAVLKNEWLAKSLGAKQFSIIFKYEPVS